MTLCITASVGCMPSDVVYFCQCWMYASCPHRELRVIRPGGVPGSDLR